MARSLLIILPLLLLWWVDTILASQNDSIVELRITETTVFQSSRESLLTTNNQLGQRQVSTEGSICGYENGDPSSSYFVSPGQDCRLDFQYTLWRGCDTTLTHLYDCGIAAICVDEWACSTSCGLTTETDVLTITCTESDPFKRYCGTQLLSFSQYKDPFTSMGCGSKASSVVLFATPTSESTSSTESSSSIESSSNAEDKQHSSTSGPNLEPTTSSQPATGPASTNVGAIVGGVLGGLALVCGTVVAVVYIWRRNRRTRDEGQISGPSQQGGGDTTTQLQPDKYMTSYTVVPPSEADSTALARDQIPSYELYSNPNLWQQPTRAAELG
ncbi:hypothetical protein F5Y11DRAFT_334977 [Daldinia sp. FL1419]|nr:hypothetical protein F5Y11DRAFT_334977 [Daldinia sp. FL1419]